MRWNSGLYENKFTLQLTALAYVENDTDDIRKQIVVYHITI